MTKPKRRPVKPISDPKILNINHPSLYGKTEFAFDSGGTKYYNFKADTEVRYGRYVILQAYMQEYNLRMDLDLHKENIKKLKGWLNPALDSHGGVVPIRIDKCNELLEIMEQRANLAFEPETVYRLASCLFFDEQEILSDYDKEYNEVKIARWKEDNTTDFFFHRLFIESTRLRITSKTDLLNYLKQVPELTKGWNTATAILSR